jgi:hypothetical protein
MRDLGFVVSRHQKGRKMRVVLENAPELLTWQFLISEWDIKKREMNHSLISPKRIFFSFFLIRVQQ